MSRIIPIDQRSSGKRYIRPERHIIERIPRIIQGDPKGGYICTEVVWGVRKSAQGGDSSKTLPYDTGSTCRRFVMNSDETKTYISSKPGLGLFLRAAVRADWSDERQASVVKLCLGSTASKMALDAEKVAIIAEDEAAAKA